MEMTRLGDRFLLCASYADRLAQDENLDGRAPFGGFKESGIGRVLGFEGVLEFVEYHSISSAPGWLF